MACLTPVGAISSWLSLRPRLSGIGFLGGVENGGKCLFAADDGRTAWPKGRASKATIGGISREIISPSKIVKI